MQRKEKKSKKRVEGFLVGEGGEWAESGWSSRTCLMFMEMAAAADRWPGTGRRVHAGRV